MTSSKVWFITGSSTGFGRAVTEFVLKSGDIAVATLRNPSALSSLSDIYPADRLLLVKLDVKDTPTIAAAFAKAVEAFGRVDVVFNNAGYGVLAEAEGTPDDLARAQFDVDFWGAANVTREAVRVFRDVNSPPGGRILQNSSVAVFTGLTCLSYYSATKSALEGFSLALASELDQKWNIKIILIKPGAFNTDGTNRSLVRVPAHPAYTQPDSIPSRMRAAMTDPNLKLPGDATKAAAIIYRVAGLPDPPVHFPLGRDCIAGARRFVASLTEAMDKYETWSEEVLAD